MHDPADQEGLAREAARATRILARPDHWIEDAGDGYAIRASRDRRRRPAMQLSRAAFEALAADPGLRRRGAGGYVIAGARGAPDKDVAAAGRPGFIEGVRHVMDDGGGGARRANVGQDAIAWMARRKDARGAPMLTVHQLLAARRLMDDYEAAGLLARMTTNWEQTPRAPGRPGANADPSARRCAARDRVHAAMVAMGPGLCAIVEHVCLRASAMDAAERDLGLPRRSGKAILRMALDRLAAHYRIG